MKELEILQPKRKKKNQHPRKIACNWEITASNQLWEMDVKYGYIANENRFFYLLSMIDVYDRAIVDYHMGLTCEGKHAVQVLKRGLLKRQQYEQPDCPVLRTDNGPQFICHVFEQFCSEFEILHERIPPKTPNKNAHIESFHSSLEKECLIKHEFQNYPEAYQAVTNYIDFYNKRRIHGSLYDLSPYEFMQAIIDQEVQSFVVKV